MKKEMILSFLNYHSNNVDNEFIRNQAMHVSKWNSIIRITILQVILLYTDNKQWDDYNCYPNDDPIVFDCFILF